MTFYEWICKRRYSDTWIGDFVLDVKRDKEAPQIENTRYAWETHLWGACGEAKEAFSILWRRYQKAMKNGNMG